MTQRPTHIRANSGLCQYEPPDTWFDRTRIKVNLAICTNCPVQQACAQSALDRGEAHGIWGGVKLPGTYSVPELEAARDRLREVIKVLEHQTPEHRQHTARMHQAIHFAVATENARRRAARERRAAAIRAVIQATAAARSERVGA